MSFSLFDLKDSWWLEGSLLAAIKRSLSCSKIDGENIFADVAFYWLVIGVTLIDAICIADWLFYDSQT